jgi:hypothetical protein
LCYTNGKTTRYSVKTLNPKINSLGKIGDEIEREFEGEKEKRKEPQKRRDET